MMDAARFTEIYHQHSVTLYRFALHMSGSVAVAEEVTQETFLAYIRRPDAFDQSRGTLGGYLYGVARNLVYRHLQQNRRFQQVEEESEEQICSPADGLLDELTRSEDLQALQDAVLCLPSKYREAIVLCDLQEMSYESAAEVLACAVGTVRSRLHRGRGLLVAKLTAKQRIRCTV